MALGSPLSFVLGGGPDPALAAYEALRSAVGIGGAAPGGPSDSIVEAFRYAKARGLAAVFDEERVVAQISPALATDLLLMYEQLLGKFFPLSVGDEQRRRELAEAWVKFESAVGASVLEALQALDSTITIADVDLEETREVQFGRAFEDWDPNSPQASGPAFSQVVGPPKCTAYPNYSDEFHLFVSYPLGSGVMNPAGARVIKRIGEVLSEALPAWVDWNVYTSHTGFILDQDLLDVTAFG